MDGRRCLPSRVLLVVLGAVMEVGDWVVSDNGKICGQVVRTRTAVLPNESQIWVKLTDSRYTQPIPYMARYFEVVPEAVVKIINS